VTARKPWSSFEVLLAASGALALLFLSSLVLAALAGYLSAGSGTKTVEVNRYVSVANSPSAPPARSAPHARSAPPER
jgi:hypothetical protein